MRRRSFVCRSGSGWPKLIRTDTATSGMCLSFRCAVFAGNRYFLTHVNAAVCSAVIFRSCEVIYLRRKVDPNNGIGRTASLCRNIIGKLTGF